MTETEVQPEVQPTIWGPVPLPPIATAQPERIAPVCYVAGPYRDRRGTWYVEQNIRKAEAIAVELWRLGYAVICPHTNTRHMDGAFPSSDNVFLDGDLEIVKRVDVLITVPDWHRSIGASNEVKCAAAHGIPVLHWAGYASERALIEKFGLEGVAWLPELKARIKSWSEN